MNCLQCNKEYETECILQDFCCKGCEDIYWKNPQKAEITTKCPKCKEDWTRTIDMTQLRTYQAAILCNKCSGGPNATIVIQTNKRYEPKPAQPNETTEETCERVLDGYPLIYHLAKGRNG